MNWFSKRNEATLPPFDYEQLFNLQLGSQQGEQDVFLKDSFIVTESVRRFLGGSYNYVLSPKGFGKSALFSAIENNYIENHIVKYENKLMIFINRAFGYDEDYLNDKKFRKLGRDYDYVFAWAVFILNKLFIQITKDYSNSIGYDDLIKNISRYKDLKEEFELYTIIERIEMLSLSLVFEVNGQEIAISPKIKSNKELKKIRLNKIFEHINEFLILNNIKAEIYIDRIDKFVSSAEYVIQKKYIQGLFDTIEEISQLSNIRPILFLRTDLFFSMDISFEFDKVRDRITELEWTQSEILTFILTRLYSNKYINKNYSKYLLSTYHSEIVKAKQNNTIFSTSKKFDLKRNFDFRFSEMILSLFFPTEVTHLNANKDFVPEKFTYWLFSHFAVYSNSINPRCIIWYFNNLFKTQYYVYKNDPSILGLKKEILPKKDENELYHFPIFLNEVITDTYQKAQKDELKTIYSLFTKREEIELFKKINISIVNNNKYYFSEHSSFNETYSKEDYHRHLKYFTILGYIKYDEILKYYISPIIYQALHSI